MSCLLRYANKCLVTCFYKSLDRTEKLEIGLKFDGLSFEPPL